MADRVSYKGPTIIIIRDTAGKSTCLGEVNQAIISLVY